MIRKLMYKWFGLTDECVSCEILRDQLHKCEIERASLLNRLLEGNKPLEPVTPVEEFRPVTPQHVPWRVRQQMLEQEDRKAAQLMHDKAKEIEELEKELGIAHEPARGSSGGIVVELPVSR